MDIYNDDENVISSDEYSDNDDLLNVAVSSANVKTEIQKPTFQPTIANKLKPQKRLVRTLAIKLKKKSVKWMQHKLKRNRIRNRYLYCIERAKTINKQERDVSSGTSFGVNVKNEFVKDDEPRKPIVEENPNQLDADKKLTAQHETIDLDDSDEDDDRDHDDDDDDTDNYDDDDDSSTNSSNDEEEDIDETNNDEINNDEVVNDLNADCVEDLNNVIEDKNNEAPIVTDEIKFLETNAVNNIANAEEPKQTPQFPVISTEPFTIDATVYSTSTLHIANSTMNEEQQPQQLQSQEVDDDEVIDIIPADIIKAPNNVCNNISTLELQADNTCNTKKIYYNNASTMTNNNDSEILNISKDLGIEQSFFFNDELNAMYSSFDKIVNEHVAFPETAEIIKQRIQVIAADVEQINKALEIKERECNQLLYVKHTKEQILARLLRKIKRNEVNTIDPNEIEMCAARELGIVPKQTKPCTKEPPPKKRKFEPRTAQEIIEHGASMSMDQALRANAQNQQAANFIDETMKRFSSPLVKGDHIKRNSNKITQAVGNLHEPNLKWSLPERKSFHQTKSLPNFNAPSAMNHKPANRSPPTAMRSQNLLLNLLNAENDSDDASMNGNVNNFKNDPNLENLFEHWTNQQQYRRPQSKQQHYQRQQQPQRLNSNNREDETYEVVLENETPIRKSNEDSIAILNQSKNSLRNSDETLIVHLDVNDFKDNNYQTTQKLNSNNKKNIANNFICQFCGIHKAQYVCAECENQWYCSRSCQVKAWDSHCETCE